MTFKVKDGLQVGSTMVIDSDAMIDYARLKNVPVSANAVLSTGAASNLDTLVDNQVFSFGDTATGAPVNGVYDALGMHLTGTGQKTQLVNMGTGGWRYRTDDAGTWGSWNTIYDNTNMSNVENKSSATIRGELTAANVQNALTGYLYLARTSYPQVSFLDTDAGANLGRWGVWVNEGGGSFMIGPQDDTGSGTGSIQISRAGGVINYGPYLSANNNANSADVSLVADGKAGFSKYVSLKTNNVQRWNLISNQTAESGSNVGSDFSIARYSDAGAYLDSPVAIARNTGDVVLGHNLTVQGATVLGDNPSDGLLLRSSNVKILGMATLYSTAEITLGRSDDVTDRNHKIVYNNSDLNSDANYVRFDIHNATTGSRTTGLTLTGSGAVVVGSGGTGFFKVGDFIVQDTGTNYYMRPTIASGGIVYIGSSEAQPSIIQVSDAGTTLSGTTSVTGDLNISGISTSATVQSARLTLLGDRLENYLEDIDTGVVGISYRGYNGGTTRFRNMIVFDGKGSSILSLTGSTKAASFAGDVTISGNLTLNGATTTINSTVTTLDDPIITLGGDTAPVADDAKDRGVEFRYYNAGAKVGFMGYDRSNDRFMLLINATNTGEVFSGTKATLDANLVGNVTGTLTGNASNVSGTVAIANGGTGATTAAAALTALGGVGYASMQGGRSYVTHDYSTYISLYEMKFINPTGSTGAPTIQGANNGYLFGMGAGDVASRGFELLGVSGGNGKLAFRERQSGVWNTVWTEQSLTNLNQLTNGPGYIGSVGGTLAGTLNLGSNYLDNAVVRAGGLSTLDKGNSGTSAVVISVSTASSQQVTATGNHTFSFSNWPASGIEGYVKVDFIDYGAFTVTPPTVTWTNPDGTETTSLSAHFIALAAAGGRSGFTASGRTKAVFWCKDAGTTVFGRFI